MYHSLIDEGQPSVSRFTGCLLGGALGDALGYPVEFIATPAIVTRYGVRTPATMIGEDRPAVVSDDTQMTLFTAEALIRDHQRILHEGPGDLMLLMQRALLRWYRTQLTDWPATKPAVLTGALINERRLYARRAPGLTCLSALGTGDRNTSKGCGAVMRVAPIGLASGDAAWAFEVASEAGALTHHHPSGYLSGAYLAAVISGLVLDQPFEVAMAEAETLLRQAPGHEETLAAVQASQQVAADGPPDVVAIERLGGGWVGEEALAISLACALTADRSSPQGIADALWRAVAHSGDSDSTGAITGNLLGAMVGIEGLPAAWLADLEMVDLITRLATDLHRATVLGESLDETAYPGA
ncbi:MAG: ADP-ribosylglycohydrolase family protein [Candidatus Sericytochromatia bacterium]|nr:ADP-ribosylglycohydrolase family protein [Candidatus Sericytochromatia bacterium]